MSRDRLLDIIEEVRNERDGIYCSTVNPRRNVRRALNALERGDHGLARHYLETAQQGLDGIAQDYDRLTLSTPSPEALDLRHAGNARLLTEAEIWEREAETGHRL